MANEIITIYKDDTYEDALYPRTLASAVQWINTKTLPQKIGEMDADIEDAGKFCGIDTENIIASWQFINSTPITMPSDGWLVCNHASGGGVNELFIDGVMVAISDARNWKTIVYVPVKKGQNVTSNTTYYQYSAVLYGLKK